MESLKEKIQQDMREAFKAGNSLKRSALSMLLAAIKNKEIERRGRGEEEEMSNDDIMEVTALEVKKRKEAAEQFEKGGRPELAQKEKEEMVFLQRYLPEQMGEKEIAAEVSRIIQEIGARGMNDMGKVMGEVMKNLKGRADGSVVSRIVKEKLSS